MTYVYMSTTDRALPRCHEHARQRDMQRARSRQRDILVLLQRREKRVLLLLAHRTERFEELTELGHRIVSVDREQPDTELYTLLVEKKLVLWTYLTKLHPETPLVTFLPIITTQENILAWHIGHQCHLV